MGGCKIACSNAVLRLCGGILKRLFLSGIAFVRDGTVSIALTGVQLLGIEAVAAGA